jgi:hypothetical protein
LVKTFPLRTFKRLNVQTFLDVLTQVTMAIPKQKPLIQNRDLELRR